MQECSVSHCNNPANSKKLGSYCESHYQISYRGIEPESRVLRNSSHKYDVKCWVDSCARPVNQNGLCGYHAHRAKAGKIEVDPSLGLKLNPMCSFSGCKNRANTVKSGLCHSHDDQLRQGRKLSELRDYGKYVKGVHICFIEKCSKPATHLGACSGHGNMLRTYRLSKDRLQELMGVESCSNPGCTNSSRLHIDHDHETGVVRGMLCSGCNTALGHLAENLERIRGLAEYKIKHA